VRRRIAVVIQESAAELFLSVADNLSTFGRFHGLSAKAIRTKSEDVIEQFGLAPEAHRKVMDLSGGFRRRVQVAKAFMVETPVLFLDEFSTGMDPILKRAIMGRLRGEASRGRTIVLTTQILSEAEDLCDDILIMHRGREAARGDIHRLKMMSAGLYDVTVAFDRVPATLDDVVAKYHPRRIDVNQNTVTITLKGQESSALDLVADLGRLGHVLRLEVAGASLEDIFIELTSRTDSEPSCSALEPSSIGEGKIRATNLTFTFWDLFYRSVPARIRRRHDAGRGMTPPGIGADYNAFSGWRPRHGRFRIASNTAWSFFMDRDNGIFFEMLTYPMRRAEYLVGKCLFNLLIAVAQAAVTVILARAVLGVPIRCGCCRCSQAVLAEPPGGSSSMRSLRYDPAHDIFNTVTSCSTSCSLRQLDVSIRQALPSPIREIAYANPITWHVDVLRFATIGMGAPSWIAIEAAAFAAFTVASFAAALWALRHQ
jgi:ABC-type multidrug transport system ATPase subunit